MRDRVYKEADENDFSDWLKRAIPRDLAFRGIIIYLITILAAVLAVERDEITFLGYFERAGAIAPLVNIVGTGVLLLCVVALYSKDLEFVSNDEETIAAARGYIAGFVRVVSQYMTLWLFAAMVAVLGALSAAAISASSSAGDALPITLSIVVLLIFTVAIGAAYTFVRRGGPTPWAKECSSTVCVHIGYAMVLALLIWRVIEGRPLPT